MPLISVQPRDMQDGTRITRFTDTVDTSQTTYTFQASQEMILLRNLGSKDINYTIGSNTGTIAKSEFIRVTGSFDSLVLSAAQGTQAFEIISDESGATVTSPELITLSNTVSMLSSSLTKKMNQPDSVFFGPLTKAKQSASVRSNWWLCGDSKEDSFGASSAANRAINQVASKIRNLYPSGAPGGEFKKARTSVTDPTNFVFSGSNWPIGLGFGNQGKQLAYNATTPGKATLTNVTCTEFELFFYQMGVDQVTITVDGTLLSTYTLPSTACMYSSGVLAKNAGTDVHTIVVQQSGGSGSGPVLAGINLINGDKSKGIHIVDHTFSGSSVSDFIGDSVKEGWVKYIPLITPSLVVMEWLTNDCVNINSTTYEANVRTFINLVRNNGAPNVPFLLMPPEEPSDRTMVEPWQKYLDALAKIASDTPFVRFYDVSKRIPKQGNGNPNGIYIDAVHYAPFFQETWAQMHVDAITGQLSR